MLHETRQNDSPLLEYKKYRPNHHAKSHQVVPSQLFFKINKREDAEYNQGNNLLNGFQLCGGELIVPDTVGRYLKTIFTTKAMNQLIKITFSRGDSLYFRCPYHAMVINIFDTIKRIIVFILVFPLGCVSMKKSYSKLYHGRMFLENGFYGVKLLFLDDFIRVF